MNSTEKGKRIDSLIKSLFAFAALEEGFFTADLAARRRIQGDNFICHRLEFVVYNLNELKKLQKDQNQIKAVIKNNALKKDSNYPLFSYLFYQTKRELGLLDDTRLCIKYSINKINIEFISSFLQPISIDSLRFHYWFIANQIVFF
jgi:hypothetical protein